MNFLKLKDKYFNFKIEGSKLWTEKIEESKLYLSLKKFTFIKNESNLPNV